MCMQGFVIKFCIHICSAICLSAASAHMLLSRLNPCAPNFLAVTT